MTKPAITVTSAPTLRVTWDLSHDEAIALRKHLYSDMPWGQVGPLQPLSDALGDTLLNLKYNNR